jgi:hypothetical protein
VPYEQSTLKTYLGSEELARHAQGGSARRNRELTFLAKDFREELVIVAK